MQLFRVKLKTIQRNQNGEIVPTSNTIATVNIAECRVREMIAPGDSLSEAANNAVTFANNNLTEETRVKGFSFEVESAERMPEAYCPPPSYFR